ncbi:dATP/dGTP diphosphohydrolase domain-containing protein [Burkholderia ambifaria]|uniref:dATP/dGTP diphosphohydrolase domain-containing protein n=1 Tax=Burkholderia ambifaria TaxID=152480 RepID=UPI001ABA613C|nr:dATP/dGTP diphosphohydrolase domain-containing protein [Burkholderia ambifaria]
MEGIKATTSDGRTYFAGFEPPRARGMKFDGGKPRFDLLEFGCADALLGVVKVMTWAIEVKGYEPHSWQGVEDAETRYTAAIRRHQNARARGQLNDPESGYPEEWHIATNALFLAQLRHNRDASVLQPV